MLNLPRFASGAFSACLLFSSLAHGQDARGTITGRVTDPHDSGIAGARVLVTNVETGVALRLTTNDKGTYSAPLLNPGNYAISATHDGFKQATRNGITVSVSDDLQVDL